MQACTRACTHAHTRSAHKHTCTRAHTGMCAHTHTHARAHTHACTHTQARAHTHTHSDRRPAFLILLKDKNRRKPEQSPPWSEPTHRLSAGPAPALGLRLPCASARVPQTFIQPMCISSLTSTRKKKSRPYTVLLYSPLLLPNINEIREGKRTLTKIKTLANPSKFGSSFRLMRSLFSPIWFQNFLKSVLCQALC